MTDLARAMHDAYRATQRAAPGSPVQRVHVITTLGPTDLLAQLAVADKVIGARGMSWSFTTAGPIWGPS